MKFKDFQDAFQRAIVAGDDSILDLIPDGAHEKRAVLLGVYRDGYVLRLVEVVQNDQPLLHMYLGDEAFDSMARTYIVAHPSGHPNARWFSRHLPEFLASTEPYASHRELSDLALLEKTLADAFDAPDAPVLDAAELAKIDPTAWGDLVFESHPSAKRLDLETNAAEIWAALKSEEEPPKARVREEAAAILVWRNETTPMFRVLPPEEAMMWSEAERGATFAVLCEMVAAFDDPDTAAVRAAGYLQGWLASGALSRARLKSRKVPRGRARLASGAS